MNAPAYISAPTEPTSKLKKYIILSNYLHQTYSNWLDTNVQIGPF